MHRKSRVLFALLALSGSAGCALVGKSAAPAVPSVEMVPVKGGCYSMGSPPGVGGPEERPAHEVCVGDFQMGKFEVTQGQWMAVMGRNPSRFAACGDECPVEMVSWNDVQDFLGKLNARSDASQGKYRLPTEAEWEYAARSGGRDEKYAGSPGGDVEAVAWYLWTSEPPVTHPVGQKAPNALGLHDMSGNVWEWTADWYGVAYYASSPRDNPTGPASGDRRVVRGGAYGNEAFDVRTTYRNYLPPDHRAGGLGFRLVRATAK